MPIATSVMLGLFFLSLLVILFGAFQYSKLAIYLKQKYPKEWEQEIHKGYWMTGRGGTGEWHRLLDSIKNHSYLLEDTFITGKIKLIKSIKLLAILLIVLLIIVVIFYKR
jgi:hypothetical protein